MSNPNPYQINPLSSYIHTLIEQAEATKQLAEQKKNEKLLLETNGIIVELKDLLKKTEEGISEEELIKVLGVVSWN